MPRTANAKIALCALLLLPLGPTTALACGVQTDCKIGDRTYRIRMPEGVPPGKAVPALIFNHGYRGTAAGLMRNKRLGKVISDMGIALIASKSAGADWRIPNTPSAERNPLRGEEELPYFDALKKQLVDKHNIDPNKIMVTGFSAGGMMTWYLACHRGEAYAGFIPMAGTFWRPVPPSCPQLSKYIVHIHGSSDRIVPFTGRAIGNTHQGNIFRALDLATSELTAEAWKKLPLKDGLACNSKTSRGLIQFCTHPGGHSFQSKWLAGAWKKIERSVQSSQ